MTVEKGSGTWAINAGVHFRPPIAIEKRPARPESGFAPSRRTLRPLLLGKSALRFVRAGEQLFIGSRAWKRPMDLPTIRGDGPLPHVERRMKHKPETVDAGTAGNPGATLGWS